MQALFASTIQRPKSGPDRKPLPGWDKRIAWFLREKLAQHAPPIPWHWLSTYGKRHCACCHVITETHFEGIPYCRIHESEVLAEIARAL